MSHVEHEWSKEQLAAHVAGGLGADERARLEAHVAACAECIAEIDELRRFERGMDDLFAPVRPRAGLEERVIRALRAAPARVPSPFAAKLSLAAAAVVLVGLVGYIFQEVDVSGGKSLVGVTEALVAKLEAGAEAYRVDYMDRGFSGVMAGSLYGREGDARLAKSYRMPKSGADFAGAEGLRIDGAYTERHADPKYSVLYAETLPSGGEMAGKAARISDVQRQLDNYNSALSKLEADQEVQVRQLGVQLPSAGEMARANRGEYRFGMNSAPEVLQDRLGVKDRSESADAEEIQKAKGDSLDFASDKPFKGKGTYDVIGGAGGGGRYGGRVGGKALTPEAAGVSADPKTPVPAQPPEVLERQLALKSADMEHAEQGKSDEFFRFRDNRAADPGYFKPADANKVDALALADDRKKADEMRRVPAPKAEPLQDKSTQQAQGQGKGPGETPAQEPPKAPERKVIRNGEIEFEVDSFDAAAGRVDEIAREQKGFVATVNSEKLPNGKVKGTVVVRCPPEMLDDLVKKLRGLGDIKSQRITSQDVTKAYYDLESRLKAARVMEARLKEIIKTGVGAIKDLVAAEKELGEWITRIETFEGEKRFYDSQVAQSTLTITLYERELRTPFAVIETENVRMSLEVEEVIKAHQLAIETLTKHKGRITKSDLKQHAAGQLQAVVHAEVPPDAAFQAREDLRLLGTVASLDVQRSQQSEGGTGRPGEVAKVKKSDAVFMLSIYNLANIQPRQSHTLSLACADPEAVHAAIVKHVNESGGRVVTSRMTHERERAPGFVHCEIPEGKAAGAQEFFKGLGEVMKLQTVENPDAQNTTKSKRGFQVQLYALGAVEPRETTTISIASKDVAASFAAMKEAVGAAKGRIITAQLDENDRQNISATLHFDFRREKEVVDAIDKALAAAGEVYTRASTRAPDADLVVDSKGRFQLTFLGAANIPARETWVIGVEVPDVDRAVRDLKALGREIESRDDLRPDGQKISRVVVDVPFAMAPEALAKVKDRAFGHVRFMQASRNHQASDGPSAKTRLVVTVSDPEKIVASDAGLAASIKKGLQTSLSAISWSLTVVVIGLCFVVPWGLIAWAGWKVYRKTRPKPAATA